jgi:hypothetical protein
MKIRTNHFNGVQFAGNYRGKPYLTCVDAIVAARRINYMLDLWEREGFSIVSVYKDGAFWYLSRYYGIRGEVKVWK